MTFVWAGLFILAVLAFWFLNLFSLPGNWMIAATTALYAWLIPADSRVAIGWPVVAVVAGLALIGEMVQLAAGAAGVKKAGGTRLGALLALIGSVVGAITGMFIGVPIPVVGSLIAALLFAGLGALTGAMLGEVMGGQSLEASWKIGQAAFWGHLFGAFAKGMIGAVMAGVVIAAVLF